MSDSDDTDVLLLIPPDFFLVDPSDSDVSNYVDDFTDQSVFHELMSQVSQLEDRVSIIESKDIPSQSVCQSLSSMNSSNSTLPFSSNKLTRYDNSGFSTQRALTSSDSNLNLSPSRKVTRFHSLPPTPSSNSSRSLSHATLTAHDGQTYYPSLKKNTVDFGGKSSQKSSPGFHHYLDRNKDDPSNEKAIRKESNPSMERDTYLNKWRSSSQRSGLDAKKDELIAEALPPSPQKPISLSTGIAQLQLDEVDRLLREVEAEQRHIEAKLSSHDAPEVRKIVKKPGDNISSIPDLGFGVRAQWGNVDRFLRKEQSEPTSVESVIAPHNTKKPGESIGSIPDLGFGLRDAWSNPDGNKKQSFAPSSNQEMDSLAEELPIDAIKYNSQESSQDASLPKQNPKVFHSRRKLDLNLPASFHSKEKTSQPDIVDHGLSSSLDSCLSDTEAGSHTAKFRSKRSTSLQATGQDMRKDDVRSNGSTTKPLLSLADLWSEGEVQDLVNSGHSKLLQKYEEECFRRQHCEHLVQAYQKKLLECQQKLAVALRVDSDKDAAILKLQDAWRSLADHWRVLEDQRHTLSQELQDQRSKSGSQVKQMQQKLEYYETELCKALDLAHGYKVRSESMEQTHQSQLEQLSSKVHELERRHAAAVQSRAESESREETLRKQLEKSHSELLELQARVEEAARSLTTCEADAAVLAEEKNALQTRLKEERGRLDMLQQSKNKLKVDLEESIKREHILQCELKKCTSQLDSIKAELHDFYQAQLERVVREKLKEFQAQLDSAESTLQKELESRECSVAQLAARQLQHVTDKHKLEISLLEEKQAEELRLMQLQLAESSRKIKELQARLIAYEKRSSLLAERLHGVMENQWKEALNILSSPNDKIHVTGGNSPDPKTSLDFGRNDTERAWVLVQQQQHQQRSQSEFSGQSSGGDDAPFSKDGQITHHTPDLMEPGEDLKKYIKMLLERAPGNPFGVGIPQVSSAKIPPSQNIQVKPPWK